MALPPISRLVRSVLALDDAQKRRIATRSLIFTWTIGIAGLAAATFVSYVVRTLPIDYIDPNIPRFVGWLTLNAVALLAAWYVGAWRSWVVTVVILFGLTDLLLRGLWLAGIIAHPILTMLILILPLVDTIMRCRSSLAPQNAESSVSQVENIPSQRSGSSFMTFLLDTACVLVSVSVIGVSFTVWMLHINGPYCGASFDATRWRQGVPRSNRDGMFCYDRATMAEDLQRILLSRRPSKEEVIKMLGKPDYTRESRQFGYELGVCSGFGFDYDHFIIRFDASNRVMSANMVQG